MKFIAYYAQKLLTTPYVYRSLQLMPYHLAGCSLFSDDYIVEVEEHSGKVANEEYSYDCHENYGQVVLLLMPVIYLLLLIPLSRNENLLS